jgi:hypothetical protein
MGLKGKKINKKGELSNIVSCGPFVTNMDMVTSGPKPKPLDI